MNCLSLYYGTHTRSIGHIALRYNGKNQLNREYDLYEKHVPMNLDCWCECELLVSFEFWVWCLTFIVLIIVWVASTNNSITWHSKCALSLPITYHSTTKYIKGVPVLCFQRCIFPHAKYYQLFFTIIYHSTKTMRMWTFFILRHLTFCCWISS